MWAYDRTNQRDEPFVGTNRIGTGKGYRMRTLRELFGRPVLPVLATMSLLLVACAEVGQPGQIGFWDLIWSMVAFFFWFMFIWIFIAIFSDIFRRNDLTGGWKAIWLILLVFLPFLGALIYMIARPKVTPQDVELMTQADAAAKAAAAVSPADQIAKLNQLKDAGAITVPEYEALKKKAIEG